MERIQKTVQSEMNRWFKRGNIGQVLIDREATGRTLSPGDLDRWLNETTAPFYTDQACDLVSMSQRPSLGLRIVSIEAESIVPKCALLEREREREREREIGSGIYSERHTRHLLLLQRAAVKVVIHIGLVMTVIVGRFSSRLTTSFLPRLR